VAISVPKQHIFLHKIIFQHRKILAGILHCENVPECTLKFFAFGNGDDNDVQKLPKERLYLEFYGKVLILLVLINKLLILLGKDKNKLFPRTFDNLFMHTDERCITAIHVFGNNIMRIHNIPTFKVTQFAPLLNIV